MQAMYSLLAPGSQEAIRESMDERNRKAPWVCFQAAYKFLSGWLPPGGLRAHKGTPVRALAPSTWPAEASALRWQGLLFLHSLHAERTKITNFDQCTHGRASVDSCSGFWAGLALSYTMTRENSAEMLQPSLSRDPRISSPASATLL